MNEGDAYNTTTGKFTAPIDEVYSFSWATISDTGNYFITKIVFNSKQIAFNLCLFINNFFFKLLPMEGVAQGDMSCGPQMLHLK